MKDWLCDSCQQRGKDDAVCESCFPDDPIRSNYQSVIGRHGTSFEDAAVQCPFYRRIYKKQRMIVCEGPIERTTTTTFYKSGELMRDHAEAFCKGDYKSCRIFKIVNDEKYEGG